MILLTSVASVVCNKLLRVSNFFNVFALKSALSTNAAIALFKYSTLTTELKSRIFAVGACVIPFKKILPPTVVVDPAATDTVEPAGKDVVVPFTEKARPR